MNTKGEQAKVAVAQQLGQLHDDLLDMGQYVARDVVVERLLNINLGDYSLLAPRPKTQPPAPTGELRDALVKSRDRWRADAKWLTDHDSFEKADGLSACAAELTAILDSTTRPIYDCTAVPYQIETEPVKE